jgi:Fuc2NAc and GlcNAc transferase
MSLLWLFPTAGCASFALTWLVRRYALVRQLVDVPNDRSSHELATARGGGFAIVLTFLCSLQVLYFAELVRPSLVLAICGGGGLVALIGFIDDHRDIPSHWRLLTHFLAAAWGLYWLGGAPQEASAGPVSSWVVNAVVAFCLVWLINLYNFMDGIDGIASIEAITVCFGGAMLYWLAEPARDLWPVPMLLLSSVMGFLYWNLAPARIFMGDAGSGFLGFVLAVLCIQAAWISAELFWAWIILLAVFVVDSTVALVRRLLRGKRLYEGHRSHAYQYASRKHGGHTVISLSVGAINLFWLLPMALLVACSLVDWTVGLAIAYLPLMWLAFRYKSGASELQEV